MPDSIVIMDGKKLSQEILSQHNWSKTDNMREPCLVIITVGNDDASKVYVRNKLKACDKCNITVIHQTFPETISNNELEYYINEYNYSPNIDGIIIQQPLPKHLIGIEQKISPDKDVDGFTKYNIGHTFINDNEFFEACTPQGIIRLIKEYNIDLTGKKVTVIGRSKIVGKPLIGLLLNEDATVTSCNSYTDYKQLQYLCQDSDIIISAVGKPKFITTKFITSRCQCIIDVGINRDENGKLCGDVDFEGIIDFWEANHEKDHRKLYITPVPGGVGPMTVAMLIHNTYIAYNNHLQTRLIHKKLKCEG